jgi:hypothetical protein
VEFNSTCRNRRYTSREYRVQVVEHHAQVMSYIHVLHEEQ